MPYIFMHSLWICFENYWLVGRIICNHLQEKNDVQENNDEVANVQENNDEFVDVQEKNDVVVDVQEKNDEVVDDES